MDAGDANAAEAYIWAPLTIDEIAAVFAEFDRPWWVAGGWAIDLHVGRQTRPHGDLDMAVLRRDQPALQRLLSSWDIRVAHDGKLTSWQRGDWLEDERHQFWVRRAGQEAWSFEVLLEDARDDVWVFRRDPRIEMPLAAFGRVTADGVPYVAPEIALLYKAKWHELERSAADFKVVVPLLDDDARGRLREALEAVAPGHPWWADLGS